LKRRFREQIDEFFFGHLLASGWNLRPLLLASSLNPLHDDADYHGSNLRRFAGSVNFMIARSVSPETA